MNSYNKNDLIPPEIVYCKNCMKHNVTLQKVGWDKSKACPLINWRGEAQGHEFDYQFCAYAERNKKQENE